MEKKMVVVMLAVVVLLFTASCSRNNQTAKYPERMNELAQDFMLELRRDILPQRDNSRTLARMGYVISETDRTIGAEYVGEFYNNYRTGAHAELTIIYTEYDPLIISRIVFPDNAEGYWFRYELQEEAAISVRPKAAETAEVVSDYVEDTINLNLHSGKTLVATFILANS